MSALSREQRLALRLAAADIYRCQAMIDKLVERLALINSPEGMQSVEASDIDFDADELQSFGEDAFNALREFGYELVAPYVAASLGKGVAA